MTINNTFEFIGTLRFPKEAVKEREAKSGWTTRSLNLIVAETKENSKFASIEGGRYPNQEPKIFTFSKGIFGEKGGKLEVDWDDRFDKDTLRNVADFKKIVVDLTEDPEVKARIYELRNEIYNIERKENPSDTDKEKLLEIYEEFYGIETRKEFLHELDAIEFIESNVDDIKGKKFRVKGDIVGSQWNGKSYINFSAKNVELVVESEEKPVKNKLSGTMNLYFSKDSLDTKPFKKERKMLFDTYIAQYSSAHGKDILIPFPTMFNASNHNDENPKHVAHIELVEDIFTVKDKKKVYNMPFEVRFVNGAEVKEPELEDLTDHQRKLVEIGMAEIKDFVKQAYGDRVTENRVYLPLFKDFGNDGNFSSGALETVYTVDDLVYEAPPEKDEKKPVKVAVKVEDFEDDILPF